MADVFISYSKPDRSLIQELAFQIEQAGYSVWWDTELIAGENFRKAISRELTVAKVAIVVWTLDSIDSEWVESEAQDALYHKKLLPVRIDELIMQKVPKPFDVRHTALVTDKASILRSIAQIGGFLGPGAYAPQDARGPIARAVESPKLPHPVGIFARTFTAIVFICLAASFYIIPAAILSEYGFSQSIPFILMQSDMCLFFPLLGPLLLVSFYSPYSVACDLYMRYLPWGKYRFFIVLPILVLMSWYVGKLFVDIPNRAPLGVSSQSLGEDQGCGTCVRAPLRKSVEELRSYALRSHSLAPFVFRCTPDSYLPLDHTHDAKLKWVLT